MILGNGQKDQEFMITLVTQNLEVRAQLSWAWEDG